MQLKFTRTIGIRFLKNMLLNTQIYIDPSKSPANRESQLAVPFSSKDKAKINQSILDLHEMSSSIAPLVLIYMGVLPRKSWHPANHYLLSPEVKELLSSTGIIFDFSTTTATRFHPATHRIKFDDHPNALGHIKIAETVLNSQSKSSLENFIKLTCQTK